jgi:hypothetical protein
LEGHVAAFADEVVIAIGRRLAMFTEKSFEVLADALQFRLALTHVALPLLREKL